MAKLDFINKKIFKLKQDSIENGVNAVDELLINGEVVIGSYSTMRDRVVFTNKRIISVNVQGLTGSKRDFISFPYNKIQIYSVETAGTIDLDAELELIFAGGIDIKFEFFGSNNIKEIGRMISNFIL